ncbi:MAG: AAA family ATPase [Clostridiaceae bacterium]|nr:AAA family ATPase [Clostridiaceae bacterium]
MMKNLYLRHEELTSPCKIDTLEFETTADLEPLQGIIGQERAVEALKFGLTMKKKGYNIFIAGLSGTGRNSYTNSLAWELAEKMEVPKDWVYVYNFKNPDNPKALSMNPGVAAEFKKDLECMLEQLQKEIPIVFNGTEYESSKNNLFKEFHQKNQQIIQELNEVAKEGGFTFKETEQGLLTVPLKDGRPMTQEEYDELSVEEMDKIRMASNQLSYKTLDIFNRLKDLEEELSKAIKQLDEKTGYNKINYYIVKLLKKYGETKKIKEYINELEEDVIANLDMFKQRQEKKEIKNSMNKMMKTNENFFNRYKVNLFIDHQELQSAPIINETNPTFSNLLGMIEYKNEMGMLKTDFMEIKPGSLHKANGGFLILQVKEILAQPYAWETLKRTLKTGEINIESLNKQMGHVITSSLKPEAIPVEVKVILIGDNYTYQLLYNLDEDFKKMFKIMADFDIEMKKTNDNIFKMARFIATHCKEEGLKDFHKTAIARMIEYSSRLADHQEKLSSRFNQIVEILYEADAWAQMESTPIVKKEHIEKAIYQKIYRNSKYEEKLNEMFQEGTLLIDVAGEKIGQINGLAVMGTGEHSFGKPNRITVSTHKGRASIINIEREVKKSGSLHDKGVLILSGYLGCKYAQQQPISLAVSISFEQSYSVIDGDSASSTELYAILSSIAEVPIKQGIAVTGSVNQKGEIQPIGGVNEKIEGFFDVCKLKGFTGDQGVIIPKQNIKNLMLKQEVIQAVKENKFHIYAIQHVEEGIEILTGIAAGEKDENGEYPEGSINDLIMKKLKNLKSESCRAK